ncbi:MAG: cob(I)yrinic acid a,c-diamide adenosyltransferase [Roseburia sp.]
MKGIDSKKMEKGIIQIYYGDGRGKSTAALGNAIHAASEGKNIVIVQFLKGKMNDEQNFFERLEPEIKIFRFEKSEESYEELSEEQKQEAAINIKNGLNYARKVLATGECDLLVLDEILGVIDNGLVSKEDIKDVIDAKSDEADLILTGRVLDDELREYADEIYKIVSEK